MYPAVRFRCIINYFISWKTLVFLGVIAISLQTVNIGLSWWIQTASSKRNLGNLRHPKHLGNKISNDNADILKQLALWSVLDSSGEFKFFIAVLKGNAYNYSNGYQEDNKGTQKKLKENNITLVTQCSLTHIHLIPELAKRWQGPVSVSVFLLSEEVQTGVQTMLLLHKCFPEVESNVTFSVVFPLSSTKSSPIVPASETDCSNVFQSYSQHHKRQNYDFSGIAYPNNLLRNIARKAVKSNFILVVDVDMLPSKDLRMRFLRYINEREVALKKDNDGSKTVWVLPSYEIDDGVEVPEDKEALLRLKEASLARPFYQELCWKCQKYTEYEAWEKQVEPTDEETSKKLNHLFEVLWRDPWEPFFISRTDIPLYDERFRQYGFNRISQVCELHVSGYRFLILDSAFLIHKGYKRQDSFHSTKHEEMERNRILFRQFKSHLKEKYPESSRRCY